MITEIRKIIGSPFRIISRILFLTAIVFGCIGSLISFGYGSTIDRLGKAKQMLQILKEQKLK